MTPSNLTREELFALVWERPVRDVAKEFGISDVALAKRCKNLQVPTPPRGYWQRVRSGETPKRQPLAAFVEEHRQQSRSGLTRLSEGQWEFMRRALADLEEAGVDTSSCRCANYEIQEIDPSLAADVIVCVQRNYHNWIPADASFRKDQGALYCAGKLVAKLMPMAKNQILALRDVHAIRYDSSSAPTILVRVTPGLLEEIASLLATIRVNNLDHVAKNLRDATYAWSARYLDSHSARRTGVSQICVSDQLVWFRGKWRHDSDAYDLESERIRISDIVPVDLLIPGFFDLPGYVEASKIGEYEERIRAIEFADHLHSVTTNSTYGIDSSIPDDTLALMERLWFGGEAFAAQIQRFKELEAALEYWEAVIEEEKSALVKDVLGVSKGDDVTFTKKGGVVRLRVRSAWVHITETEVTFSVYGSRYNKDGLLGKLEDSLYLTVPRVTNRYEQ